MRFLHLADLHLGKRLNDVDLIDDQKFVLMQALQRSEEVDAVLIAGDVYDKSAPSAEAMALFDWFITELSNRGKKVFIISGNHDSSERISYFSSLLKDNEIYVSSRFEGRLQSFSFADEYGKINIHLLPFVKPINVRKFYPDEEIKSYEDALRCVVSHSDYSKEERNILLVHQFITGAEESDSEEHSVGGLDEISADIFADFDYVALGHIHKPQIMKRDTLRYSGSLLKYSFSESTQNKSFCLVDFREKGNIDIKLKSIDFLHDVREREGMFEEIMDDGYSEDYVKVTLHDEEIYPDMHTRLLAIYPNMMKFGVENSKTKYEMNVQAEAEFENKSVLELYTDFYRLQNNNSDPDKAQLELLEDVIKEMEAKE